MRVESEEGIALPFQAFYARIVAVVRPYHRAEYGNLRFRTSDWDCGDGDPVTNIAIVWEAAGGRTEQINISHHQMTGGFSLAGPGDGQWESDSVDAVVAWVEDRLKQSAGQLTRE